MWQTIISWPALQQRKEYEFLLEQGEAFLEGFCFLYQNQLYAYRNRCPHQSVTLNWNPHQFLDAQGEMIVCSMHGALFQPEEGVCVYGPCLHQRLQALPVQVVADQVQVWFTFDPA